MIHRIAALAALCLLVSFGSARSDDASSATNGFGQSVASQQLLKVMAQIQKLDPAGILGLQTWASYPKPSAPDPILSDLDQIETDILFKLAPADREAVMSWLEHAGRAKLYARGLNDADIGPCVDLVDSSNCKASLAHAPNNAPATSGSSPFRDLPFAVAPGAQDTGGISIERGFAVIRSDATSETHCVTFKNSSQKKVDAVTFVYRMHAQSGAVLSAGSNVRSGSFEAGATVAGPSNAAELAGIHSDGPDKALLENCWTKTTQVATPALLRAAYLTLGVASVTYDDGTHWSAE